MIHNKKEKLNLTKTKKMKNLKFLPVIAMGLALAFTLSMSSFKSVNKLVQPANGWYQVGPDGNTINTSGTLPTAPPTNDLEGCAIEDNTGKICAVYLEFSADVAVPTTVSSISPITTPDVTNPFTARQPIEL